MRWSIFALVITLLAPLAGQAQVSLGPTRAGADASVSVSIPTITSVDLRSRDGSFELNVFQTGREIVVLRVDSAGDRGLVPVSLRGSASRQPSRHTRAGWTSITDSEPAAITAVSARGQQRKREVKYEIWQF